MNYQYHDGGRKAAGYQGLAGDCVTRAIAIATGQSYQTVYDALNGLAKIETKSKRRRGKSSARNGVHRVTYQKYLADLGWVWVPTMFIGSGCKVHLATGELPGGRLIVAVSRHLVAVVNDVIYDTHDPRREVHVIDRDVGQALKPGQWRNVNGVCSVQRRCVYGYYRPPTCKICNGTGIERVPGGGAFDCECELVVPCA